MRRRENADGVLPGRHVLVVDNAPADGAFEAACPRGNAMAEPRELPLPLLRKNTMNR